MKKIAVVEKFFEAHHQQQIEAVAGKYGYTVDYYLDGVLPQARAGEYEIVYGMPDRTALKDMTQLKWFCASFAGVDRYVDEALYPHEGVLLTNSADYLDDTFQMPFAISDYVYNTNNADMRSNETFTYREAMYAMLTRNANEAAMGLAYALSGGDLAGWVSQMNTLSQRIGTTGSTWTDACGIDSGSNHYIVVFHFCAPYEDFDKMSAMMKQMRDTVMFVD